jgi:hypothetical protein
MNKEYGVRSSFGFFANAGHENFYHLFNFQ